MKDMAEIFRDYAQHIYNYALRLTAQPEDAQDLAQETFLRAWEKLPSLESEAALAGWLRRICYREFLMRMRRRGNVEPLSLDDRTALERDGALLDEVRPRPEDEVAVAEAVRDMQNGCFLAMARKLSLNQRIAFSLVDMFGLSVDDVAELLEISRGAAKGLLYRARMNIDSFFADHCGLLDERNPCACEAWIRFSTSRSELQKRAQELNARLDFEEKGYRYDEAVRRKILCLYQRMPDQQPPRAWYDGVMRALEK